MREGLISIARVILCGMNLFPLRAAMLLLACVVVCPGAEAPVAVIPITDTASLKAHVGKHVSVSGKVSRVGRSKSGFIVFINFEGVRPGGFSAVVKSAGLPDIVRAMRHRDSLPPPARCPAGSRTSPRR